MPLSLLDHNVPLDTAEVSRWLGRKVRGQLRAVETVTGVIARIKSGLSRPGRPLASFLFTGPTGTGKTEMAKALASWLFGSADRLIRLDMSEYGQPWSAQRLVSGAHRGSEGILTAAVREQPFSVLLLDEFEKAHPAVFDLLLQVLGEARLTDAAGRTADFSNCVVIMTSNLGAEEFGKPRLGFATDGGLRDATEHFTEAVRRTLRPEMFNRIDSIVPYLPLDKVTVRELTLREIAAAAERPGLASDRISLEVSPLLVDALAAEGFDPRYGARPLKRRVAERLLAPVAAHLAEGLPPETRIIADAAPDGRVRLSILRPQHDRAEQTGRGAMWERVHAAWRLRRTTERLRRSSMVNGLTGQLRRIEREQLNARKLQRPRNRKAETAAWEKPDARRDALRRLVTRVNETAGAALQWEEEIMLAAATDEPQAVLALPACPVHLPDTEDLLLDVHMAWEPPPHALLLVLQASSGQTLMEFVRIYRTLAREFGGACMAGLFYRKTPAKLLAKSGTVAKVDAPRAAERNERRFMSWTVYFILLLPGYDAGEKERWQDDGTGAKRVEHESGDTEVLQLSEERVTGESDGGGAGALFAGESPGGQFKAIGRGEGDGASTVEAVDGGGGRRAVGSVNGDHVAGVIPELGEGDLGIGSASQSLFETDDLGDQLAEVVGPAIEIKREFAL